MDLEKEVIKIKARVEQNHAMLKSIRRHMRVSAAFGFLKLLIILVPLVLVLIYAPKLIGQYQDLVASFQSSILTPTLPQGIDLGTLQELFNKVQ